MTSNTSILGSVLRWLRAGYPQGVPSEDYLALLAVLHRRLTETEIGLLVDQLTAEDTDGIIERAEIEEAIRRLAHETPGDDDINRVAARLAAAGWPLAHPSEA
ncbi:DUF3349 domain-containing protein [Nocardia sp. NPDC056100]|uniref:DUF3349 domain-containing protein n=1 Tax=Nocardia sp. NPDC056100 TaxID=3345712 RepID=UPI0035DD3A2E